MKEKEMAENNKILEIKTGSWLYGLNTPSSDLDFGGIFLPNKEYVFGFSKCEEVDLSFKSKLENGKNSKDAIDRKLYEFRKFIQLALQNNPNILEFLFVNEDNIVFINEIGRKLLSKTELFPHQGLKERFIGYAISQKKKMSIKRDNYDKLDKGILFLEKVIEEGDGKLLLPQLNKYNDFNDLFKIKYDTDNHYKIGDRNLVKNQTAKRALQEIKQILSFSSNRLDLIKSKGYDYKFGCNLIRLLIEGKELLETGKIQFPLKNKEEIMQIKLGNWTLDEVLEYSEQLENDINKLKESSFLPSEPRTDEIEKFTMEVLEEWMLK